MGVAALTHKMMSRWCDNDYDKLHLQRVADIG